MDAVMVELLLWAGLIFFLWVLKDTMGKLESDIERSRAGRKSAVARSRPFVRARVESFSEPIGSYGGATIYRYAHIDGKIYRFEHICPWVADLKLLPHQRCIEPGLLYSECGSETVRRS
ncbi:hypothetical protein [Noviherbaspirillum pedocola]|uniref:Uncharacterized protein n=1 Tax=Noviherbaspirillum pedocola TaxID=2801341 RepID=A0A934SPW6_9BURK|nr:hypothetical protein [Noviherbaspirillum pedocola]MBK4734551.1 hypothetical protein [Noviherbaspirillum pedocola]